MRHAVRVDTVDLEYLIADAQSSVQSSHAALGQLQHEQRYVELFAAAYAEAEAAGGMLAQLDHMVLVVIDGQCRRWFVDEQAASRTTTTTTTTKTSQAAARSRGDLRWLRWRHQIWRNALRVWRSHGAVVLLLLLLLLLLHEMRRLRVVHEMRRRRWRRRGRDELVTCGQEWRVIGV